MQLADPEGFKASEEIVSETPAEITELPFVNVLNHLRQAGVSVPALYYYDKPAGLLYLEDFGDVTLVQACANVGKEKMESLYVQAVDRLVEMHLRATFPGNAACLAFRRQFNDSLLMWEFDHFLEYGVVARQGRPMREKDEYVVREEFQKIAEWMAAQPQVFTHRDYHSRNLMVDGERLGVIDFQDALRGPATYDLASLLRDSYFELEEDLIDRLIDRYVEGLSEGLEARTQNHMLLTDRSAFRRLFDLTSIQRNLKAAGRFVYIDQVKHNPNFLADIPRTLGYVRRNLEKYPELQTLRTHLTPYVPEWQ
jgi:aminoglycoside/choline kinase family phosphotransferase